MKTIPLTKVELSDGDIRAVATVLKSGMLVQGQVVERFENELARACGRQYAVCVSSGTAALQLSMQALELQGKRIAIPALTWPSPIHAAKLTDAIPVAMDVDEKSWLSGPHEMSATEAKYGQVDAFVVIDQFGMPCDREGILKAAGDRPLIEDAACALGSKFADESPCGSLGSISILSFHPRKVLTTGEGGVCLTDSNALARRVRALRNHGQVSPGQFVQASGNYRMTDFQAALGLAQLEKYETIIEKRLALFSYYQEKLREAPVELQDPSTAARWNIQTLGLVLQSESRRDAALAALQASNIQASTLSYVACDLLWNSGELARTPVAESIVRRSLCLPFFSSMSDHHVDRVVATLREAVG